MIYRLWNDDIFVETWEHGVGLVPSCGTATIAAAMKEQVNEIYCRGGKYNIEFFEKYLTLRSGKYFDMNSKICYNICNYDSRRFIKRERNKVSDKWERR